MSTPTPQGAPALGGISDERAPSSGTVRTVLTIIGLLLATALLLYVVRETSQVLTWIVVAAFFAVALYPVVGWVQRRLLGGRVRVLATLVVFLVILIALAGIGTLFVVPLAQEGTRFAGQLPQLVDDARAGRGPVGDLLERTDALRYVQDNQERIREFATGLTTPAAGVLSGVATGVAGVATIFVLAFLMVLEGPKVVDGFTNLFAPATGQRLRRVGADCAKSVTGYISGNLLISVICGTLTYVVLKVTGVPFAGLIALFVGLADLIPLVGATIGAVVASVAGFVESVPAGIAVVVFFLVYQQLENHLLQPLIFARTVKLNPLTVVVAILLAVELAGILGALLAIPVASIVQVIARDVWDHRRGRPKAVPTVGEEREPAHPADAAAPAAARRVVRLPEESATSG
ncbi:AI-2E family transporter [Kineococcus glutinatus]|uniref:AI-2E family transporter n=1 Tax=Kineococcus glutinatus TaxID=1070872 RepID=UPI0031F1B087